MLPEVARSVRILLFMILAPHVWLAAMVARPAQLQVGAAHARIHLTTNTRPTTNATLASLVAILAIQMEDVPAAALQVTTITRLLNSVTPVELVVLSVSLMGAAQSVPIPPSH